MGDQELLKRLVSQDWRERKEAVEALAQLDRLNLARAVLEIIRQDHANLSALNASLQLLERVGQPLTTEIITLLTGSDQDLRIYVPLVLAELGGPEVIQALTQAAADPSQSENVRFNAVEALGRLRAVEAAPVLIELLQSDLIFLKYGLVVALGQIGLRDSAKVLLPLLDDPILNEAAVIALGNTGDAQAAQAIGDWMLRSPASAQLAVMAVASIERRAAAYGPESGQAVREAFLGVVGKDGARRISMLAERAHLEYPQEDFFWQDLAEILCWSGEHWPAEPVIRSALVRLLAHPKARPVAELALQQVLLSEPCPVPPELLMALNSSNPEEAYAAARLLGSCTDPDSLPALTEAMDSEDEILAALAAEGAGRIATPQAIDLLLAATGDARDYLRQAAVDALASTGQQGLAAHAQRMLARPEPLVRASALRLMARLGAQGAANAAIAAMADSSADVRRAAIELLPRSDDPEMLRLFSQVLEDPDENLRRTAVQIYADLPEQAALPLLEHAVRDSSRWVRVQAVRSLGRFPGQQSLSALAESLRDPFPPVRSAVVEAMAQHMTLENLSDQARERIFKLLLLAREDEEQIVHEAAIAALERMH